MALDGYVQKYDLSWDNYVGLCTDGATAMTGRKAGLTNLVKREACVNIYK